MADLFREFEIVEQNFRLGASLPDQDDFNHSDPEPEPEPKPTDFEEEIHVSIFDDDDNEGILAEIEFLESLRPGRRTYQ